MLLRNFSNDILVEPSSILPHTYTDTYTGYAHTLGYAHTHTHTHTYKHTMHTYSDMYTCMKPHSTITSIDVTIFKTRCGASSVRMQVLIVPQ